MHKIQIYIDLYKMVYVGLIQLQKLEVQNTICYCLGIKSQKFPFTGNNHYMTWWKTVLSKSYSVHTRLWHTEHLSNVWNYLLIPISLMAEAGGPIKMTPSLPHSSANSVFSDRNPYPGWIACHQKMHVEIHYIWETCHYERQKSVWWYLNSNLKMYCDNVS